MIAIISGSCKKEKTVSLNEQLNGTWDVIQYDDKPLPSGETRTYTFKKSGDETGSLTKTYVKSTGTNTFNYNYTLNEEASIVFTDPSSPGFSATYNIEEHSESTLTIKGTTSMFNERVKMKKK